MALVTFALILGGAWCVYALVGAMRMLVALMSLVLDVLDTSGCVGRWFAVLGDARIAEAHPQAPIGRYHPRGKATASMRP